MLASIDSVRDVVGLARQLDRGRSLEDALEHLDTRVRAEVERWFDDRTHDDVLARRPVLEVTALAFSSGVDERTFETALRALHRHSPASGAGEHAVEQDHLPQLRRGLLTNELVRTEVLHTELGTRSSLTFAKPEQHRHVLAQLWQRVDIAFWDAVGDWLDEIVADPRYEGPVARGVARHTPHARGGVGALQNPGGPGGPGASRPPRGGD
ncbi:hypothetical protein K7G98_27885, partial [Saccharothrix sp. MB29]|nr:hypothetical protein [Saccharothrix sp. MB29]